MPTEHPIRVAALAATPVKGLRITARSEVRLEEHGMPDNRRFYLIDARGRMMNGKQIGALQRVRADYEPEGHRLTLAFPDGESVTSTAEPGAEIDTRFFSRALRARIVDGPWTEPLSALAGRPLRLVETGPERPGVDRGSGGAVSVISSSSIAALAQRAGVAEVDPRRFRMLVEIAGPEPYEEDRWIGRRLRLGTAVISLGGHVGRCLVTSRDPDTGEADLPTLDLLGAYRRDAGTSEPLAFGVYGAVREPGIVRVGDPVELLDR